MYVPLGYTEATMAARAKLFMTNRSQAVRLPKDLAFPPGVDEVEIIKVGSSRIITPIGKRWDDFFENGPFLSEDFSVDREGMEWEEREPLE